MKALTQPDDGEVLATRKGKVARRCLKEAWCKLTTRRTGIGYRGIPNRASKQMIAKRIVIKGWGCRSGEDVKKEIELTLGDLHCVLERTEKS